MSLPAGRDIERQITSFLEAGPDQLSSRVATAIADEVHRTPRKRAWRRLGKLPAPTRSLIGIASVAALLGIALLLGRYLSESTGSHSPTPRPSLPEPQVAIGPLQPGIRYSPPIFSIPFVFSVPDGPTTIVADNGSPHGMGLVPSEGAITIHDGIGLPTDFCHPEGAPFAQAFSSAEAVEQWLAATPGITVSKRPALAMASGSALSWDIGLAATCYLSDSAPPFHPTIWFQRNEHHRIYAVPSASGAIVLITWGSGYHGEGEGILPAINGLADQIVTSIVAP